ncbi:MAG: mechanosensitive ion channel [Verrucomicrobia bacterium]|nr:mechanosensitive ion channel [Verrucomicrobiota bacterium]
MNLNLLTLAAAAVSNTQTNLLPETAVVKLDPGLLGKFEEATGLPREVALWIVSGLIALAILVIGYLGAGIARNMVRRLMAKRHIDETIGDFAGNLAHAAVMTFVVITALGQLGIDTKTFAAVIAAAGLAIGLALQGGLSNFASGFLIIVFRPFRKGDTVTAAGIEGVVEEVQVFSTSLHTADNKKIIVPNSSIMGGVIINYTANPTRRIDLQMSVGAGQDLAKAHEALLRLTRADSRVLENPAIEVVNVKLIDGGTLIELHAWCKTGDFGGISSALVAKAPAAFAEAGIRGPDKSVIFVERK